MTWHMQHEDRLKMITGCSDIRRRMRASADSATSMDSDEDDAVPIGGLRSRRTISLEQRRRPCIAGFGKKRRRKPRGFSLEYYQKRVRERDGVDVNGGKWVFVGGGFLGSFINERMLWLLTSQYTVTTCIILSFFSF